MSSIQKQIVVGDLKWHMEYFAGQASLGIYDKLDYQCWRELKKICSLTNEVSLHYGAAFIKISNTSHYVLLKIDDQSFGTYLYNAYFKNNIEKKKEEVRKMKGFNFDFGTCEKDNIKMSMYGLAVQNNNGEWVSYNTTDGTIINVDILSFDGGKYLLKMPVAIKDVAVG